MREIVTIQAGGFANFVGSHFWNFQDELLGLAEDPNSDQVFKTQYLNMDVLYRAGETQQGIPTYTPRLVSVDLQGSLGSVSSRGTLYSEMPSGTSNVITWTGNVSTHVSAPHKKNFLHDQEEQKSGIVNGGKGEPCGEIQDRDIVNSLEDGVQYWTDFSKVHFHAQSLYELSGLWVDGQEFDNYGIGRDAFSGCVRGEDMNERLRFFVEECDHIQGIQFIVDDSGGFSGLAADYLENIADEYSNTPVLLYTVRPPSVYANSRSKKQTIFNDLHNAVSFSRLSPLCKLIVPIGLPCLSKSKASAFLQIKDEKTYHCSAAYAAALHSIGLPFRMESLGPTADLRYVSGAIDVNGMVQMLAGQARQNMVAILDAAIPAPPLMSRKQCCYSILGNLHPLTPEVAEDMEDLQAVESVSVHGALGSDGLRAAVGDVRDSVDAAYELSPTRPRFSHLSVALCPLPISLPFPSIFANSVGQHGELLDNPVPGSTSRGSLDVHSIPVAARLRSSTAVLPFLEKRLENLRRFGIQQGAPGVELLKSWGFGKDEVEDMGETLSNMVKTLDPHPYESSDSD
ncbi:DML1/Misato, tubulin domain [Dillenia turbinata]|uniref:DML1/Misato, tubulin domain n=1 Tax=Dillenia turbinata TaxID=194707 RepID=A0AAN8V454_9MAGN